MKKGEKNRTVRQTHMNVKSSRSHTIFQLLIEEVFPSKKSYRVSHWSNLAYETQFVWFGRIWENQQELKNGKWSLWGAEKHQFVVNNIGQGDIMFEWKNQSTLPLIKTHKTSSRHSRR